MKDLPQLLILIEKHCNQYPKIKFAISLAHSIISLLNVSLVTSLALFNFQNNIHLCKKGIYCMLQAFDLHCVWLLMLLFKDLFC